MIFSNFNKIGSHISVIFYYLCKISLIQLLLNKLSQLEIGHGPKMNAKTKPNRNIVVSSKIQPIDCESVKCEP